MHAWRTMAGVLALVGLVLGASGARAADDWLETAMAERGMGEADAPVTIVEYASLTCGHCARFNRDVVPELKKELVETGKARFIFRDFPLDGVALRGSLMLRCVPEDQYFKALNLLFENQSRWVRAKDPVQAMKRMLRLTGVSEATLDKCLNSKPLTDALLQERLRASKEEGIEATPTVVIDGQVFRGAHSAEALIEAAEKAAGDG